MSKKYSLAAIMLFTVSAFCFAQKFENGYIIKNNDEQVNGLIDIKSNVQNSKSCLFQDKENGTLQSFNPDEIKGFRTSGKYYISREVEIDSVKRKVFLEYLVDGIVDLYYLKDLLNEYYFIEKEGRLVPLDNREISVLVEGDGIEHNDKSYIKNSNQYKGALNYLFSDGEGLSNKVATTPFNYRSLINVTKDYHNAVCTEYECIDYTRSSSQTLNLEMSGGIIYSAMTLKTSGSKQYNLRPSLTAQLYFVPLKSNTNFKFLIGLSYSANNFHGYFENDLYYYAHCDTFDLTEKYSILRIPLNIQYEFGTKKVSPFISLGYSACLYLGADFAAYGHYKEANYPEYTEIRKYQHGFSGGAGLNYKLESGRYLFFKVLYEYRIPSVNSHLVLEYVRHHSYFFNFGYAFTL